MTEPATGVVGYRYIADQLGIDVRTVRKYATGKAQRLDDFPAPVDVPGGSGRAVVFDQADADAFIDRHRPRARRKTTTGKKRSAAAHPEAPSDLVGYAYIAAGLDVSVRTVREFRVGSSRLDYFPEPALQQPDVRSPLWRKDVADAFIKRRLEDVASRGEHPLAAYNRERREQLARAEQAAK